MKKIILVLLILWAVPDAASDVSFDRTYTQQNFRDFSEAIGAALLYRSIGPAVSLGITGFNLGVELMASDINENKDYWKKAVSGQSPPSYLVNSRISFTKGLPYDFVLGVVLGKIVDPDIPYFGAEARYAIVKDRALIPGVTIRGSYFQTFNVDQLDMKTYGLDLSVNKGFGVGIKIIPYGGVGASWVSSKAGLDVASRTGATVVAAAEGYVFFSGWTYEDGYMLVLTHGEGYATVYKHAQTLLRPAHVRDRRGEPIATVGTTGVRSGGPHLHFEVWRDGTPEDPREYLLNLPAAQ